MKTRIGIGAVAGALLLLAVTAGLVYALRVGGAADPRALVDPGAVVRYALPAARTAVNLSLAGLLGSLVMCIWALSTRSREWQTALNIAAVSGVLMAIASAVTTLVTYLDASGQALGAGATFTAGFMQFIVEIELGRLWVIETILAATVATLAVVMRGRRTVLVPFVGAALLLLPLAAQGHAAGAADHSLATNAVFLHITGAAIWIGGLLTLLIIARTLDTKTLVTVTKRYSTIALFCFIVVASSGVVNGIIRLETPAQIFTERYGQLLIAKAVLITILGAFGAIQRTRLIPKLDTAKRKTFLWIVALELGVMGVTSGVSGALGRTETPRPLAPAREGIGIVPPAEWLTGDPLPPELTPMRMLTEWRFDLLWVLVSLFGIALYLYGVLVLRRRGDRWHIGRTASWVAGMLPFFYATNGYLNAYEQYLFSAHMLGHMLFTMGIPLLLVLGAPTTLALRCAQKRSDGSWGLREWIMWLVETPYAKIVTHPVIAAVIFAGSLWVFYFTPMLRWAMQEHLGHQFMIIHFTLSGYFFSLTMIGIDPIPRRFSHAMRLVTLFLTMAVHAFFGVTIMMSKGLLAADWFGAMGRTWGDTPLGDQAYGGSIAWGIGEIPTLILAIVVAVQWSMADDREQKRLDRAADRSGEAELHAYNAMLQERAARASGTSKRDRK